MLRSTSLTCALLLLSSATALAASEGSLRGSRDSMIRQHEVARKQDYTFLRTPAQVEQFVDRGYLVPLEGNENYELANVSHPFARPELRTFVERLSAQYREGCGEKLVVTSLTRPLSRQPGNAHQLSVHPAGMAVDLRISGDARCRAWIEAALLSLEERQLLDITRERHPPHYHVAVFPEAYLAHVERLTADSARVAQAEEKRAMERAAVSASAFRAADEPVRTAAIAPEADLAPGSQRWLFWSGIVLLGLVLTLIRGARPERRRHSGTE